MLKTDCNYRIYFKIISLAFFFKYLHSCRCRKDPLDW